MYQLHLEKLIKELERSNWVIHSNTFTMELQDYWEISRPNGDCPLKLLFFVAGNGRFGACNGDENMDNVNGCTIESAAEISIYFGKYTGQFQKDLKIFIAKLNILG